MTTRFVAILFAIAGCAIEGTELPVWTLSTGGQQVAITLPNNLEVAEGEAFTLRTEVPVPADLRGRALGLVADCYHGALEALVQRVPVEDDGDGAIGSWRFAIPASITSGDRLVLELVGKREPMSVIGFGAAPRLVDDPTGDPRARSVAAVNRIGATVALLTIGFLAIPYLAIYLLDRRRREYGAMLIYGLTLAHTPLTLLGAYSAFGPIGRHL